MQTKTIPAGLARIHGSRCLGAELLSQKRRRVRASRGGRRLRDRSSISPTGEHTLCRDAGPVPNRKQCERVLEPDDQRRLPSKTGNTIWKSSRQATVTLRLTGTQLEAGAAILLSGNLLLDNLIEANLTYLILENGHVSDSVGIAPSKEFYRASIPFEKFRETALALVNGDYAGEQPATSRTGPVLVRRRPGGADASHRTGIGRLIRPGSCMNFSLDKPSNGERWRSLRIFPSSERLSPFQADSSPVFHWIQPRSPTRFALNSMKSRDHYATGELALWADGFSYADTWCSRRWTAKISLRNQRSAWSTANWRMASCGLPSRFWKIHSTPEEVTMSLGNDQFLVRPRIGFAEIGSELFRDDVEF